eukprot:403373422
MISSFVTLDQDQSNIDQNSKSMKQSKIDLTSKQASAVQINPEISQSQTNSKPNLQKSTSQITNNISKEKQILDLIEEKKEMEQKFQFLDHVISQNYKGNQRIQSQGGVLRRKEQFSNDIHQYRSALDKLKTIMGNINVEEVKFRQAQEQAMRNSLTPEQQLQIREYFDKLEQVKANENGTNSGVFNIPRQRKETNAPVILTPNGGERISILTTPSKNMIINDSNGTTQKFIFRDSNEDQIQEVDLQNMSGFNSSQKPMKKSYLDINLSPQDPQVTYLQSKIMAQHNTLPINQGQYDIMNKVNLILQPKTQPQNSLPQLRGSMLRPKTQGKKIREVNRTIVKDLALQEVSTQNQDNLEQIKLQMQTLRTSQNSKLKNILNKTQNQFNTTTSLPRKTTLDQTMSSFYSQGRDNMNFTVVQVQNLDPPIPPQRDMTKYKLDTSSFKDNTSLTNNHETLYNSQNMPQQGVKYFKNLKSFKSFLQQNKQGQGNFATNLLRASNQSSSIGQRHRRTNLQNDVNSQNSQLNHTQLNLTQNFRNKSTAGPSVMANFKQNSSQLNQTFTNFSQTILMVQKKFQSHNFNPKTGKFTKPQEQNLRLSQQSEIVGKGKQIIDLRIANVQMMRDGGVSRTTDNRSRNGTIMSIIGGGGKVRDNDNSSQLSITHINNSTLDDTKINKNLQQIGSIQNNSNQETVQIRNESQNQRNEFRNRNLSQSFDSTGSKKERQQVFYKTSSQQNQQQSNVPKRKSSQSKVQKYENQNQSNQDITSNFNLSGSPNNHSKIILKKIIVSPKRIESMDKQIGHIEDPYNLKNRLQLKEMNTNKFKSQVVSQPSNSMRTSNLQQWSHISEEKDSQIMQIQNEASHIAASDQFIKQLRDFGSNVEYQGEVQQFNYKYHNKYSHQRKDKFNLPRFSQH